MKFVIHHHVTTPEHFDLMLEVEETLLTWQISAPVMKNFLAGEKINAERTHDHKKKYLTYEGPISCDRGHVSLFDSGTYRPVTQDTYFSKYCFEGEKITGYVTFTEKEGYTELRFSG